MKRPGIKEMATVLGLLLTPAGQTASAHHSREHTMLMQDPARVIAETRQGSGDTSSLLPWLAAGTLLGLGIIRLLKKK